MHPMEHNLFRPILCILLAGIFLPPIAPARGEEAPETMADLGIKLSTSYKKDGENNPLYPAFRR